MRSIKQYKTKIKNNIKKISLFHQGKNLLELKEKKSKKNILISLINIAKDGMYLE